MKLKATLTEDEFGELDESTRGLYTEAEDGRYALDVDGVEDLPAIAALRRGHKNSKRERDEAKRQAEALKRKLGPLADLEDLDLSDAEQERLEKLIPYLKGEADLPDGGDKDHKQDKHGQADLDKIRANARKPLERDLATVAEERDALKAKLQALVTDSALTSAVAEIKVAGPFVKAVKAMFRDKVKMAEGDDGTPVAMIEGEYGEQPVDKYLKEWAQTDEGKEFIQAPNNGGGGSPGGKGGNGRIKNPFLKKRPDGGRSSDYSVTEQGRLVRENPEMARRMAREAGWRDHQINW